MSGPDLVAFVTARLDEDEAVARAAETAAGSLRAGEPYGDEPGVTDRDDFPSYPWGQWADELAFMAGPGHPAHVLREVAAMRAIVTMYARMVGGGLVQGGVRHAVLAIAAIWSEHADYRAEWTPDHMGER